MGSNIVRDQMEQIIISEADHQLPFLLVFFLEVTPAAEGAAVPAGDAPADGKPPHDKHQGENDAKRWNPSCLWFNVQIAFSK